MLAPRRFFFNRVSSPANLDLHSVSIDSGINNADGAPITVLPALEHDVHYLVFGISGGSQAAVDTHVLADFLIDRAGGTDWSELISDVVCGYHSASYGSQAFHLPLWIPAGASIGCRSRLSSSPSEVSRLVLAAFGEPNDPSAWWCGQKVESLGINPAASKGTNITPGDSGAFGSWTNIGSVTSARYGAVAFGINGTDAIMNAIGYYWQIGHSSLKLVGSPTFYSSNNTSEVAARHGWNQPLFCDIPVGTQMQMRATASGSAEVHDAAIYGVY